MRLHVRSTLDSTPLVKLTKAKLIDLRTSLKEREEPIGNATIDMLFASLSAAYSSFIEQGWCSGNAVKFIRDLEVAERPFLWVQSAGEVQKLLTACNENIRTLVAALVGTGMRLDEALHLMWTVDLAAAQRFPRRASLRARSPRRQGASTQFAARARGREAVVRR